MKCDCIHCSIQNDLRHSILFSFVLDKPLAYKVFFKPEMIQFKKFKKSVLYTITFYLEDDKNEELIFKGETLTFTLQLNRN